MISGNLNGCKEMFKSHSLKISPDRIYISEFF